MRIAILFVGFLLAGFYQSDGQANLSADFSFPSEPYTVCLNEVLQIQNNSQNAIEYLWDFCPETFTETPLLSDITPVPGLSSGWGYKIMKDGNEWIALLVSRNSNKLFRLEFGNDPSNIPEIFDLGNPGDLFVSPQGLDIVNQDGNWFAFVGKGQTTTGEIVRLDFGSSLKNAPVATGLGTFGTSGRRLRDLKVIKQDVNWVLIIALDTDNALLRINYRDSFNNAISSQNISSTGPLTNANLLLGFSVLKNGGNWIVHTVSYSNHGVQQYSFGDDIFSAPSFQGNFTFSSVTRPYFIKVIREADSYYGFVGNESKNLSIIKFGDFTTVPEELPNSTLPKFIGFDLIKNNSKNIIQGTITGTTSFRQVIFENLSCASEITFSTEETPSAVSFNVPATYKIELSAQGVDSQSDIYSRILNVSTSAAPVIEMVTENVCLESPIGFSVNSDSPLKEWNWDFGDNEISSEAAPIHTYAAEGGYIVRIHGVDLNNCSGRQQYLLSIFSAPVAEFSLPPSLLCTNNEVLFPNTTTDIYNGNLSSQWYVDGNPVSTERDLQTTFTATGSKEIKLITSIPGCSDEIIKTTSFVEAGPVVDFTYSGTCEDEMFSFQQQISDLAESYLWDFGGAVTSPDPNPSHTFTGYGDFQVSLTATNSIGCNNVKTKTVAVHTKPLVDFSAAPPPNTCSGVNTIFQNQTVNPDGRQIVEWLWDFGDANDRDIHVELEGQHVFVEPGTYNVTLTSTTGAGCNGTAEKQITILRSPSTDISFTPACEDIPVIFTGPNDPDIATWYWEIGTSYYDSSTPTHTFKSPGDYPFYLEMTSSNNCVSVFTSEIHVPVPLIPDFTHIRNCVGQEAVLTDVTTGDDPVVSREWNFNGGEVSTVSPVTHTFLQEGNENLTLRVTTAAGCSYAVTRMIGILPPPVAGFSSSPSTGAYPLDVSFSNSSTSATQYLWDFWPGSTSIEVSPDVTFGGPGSYEVKLTAFNEQLCEDSFVAVITTVDPIPDVDIEMITLTPNDDGSMKLIVTIHNKGNTILKALPIDLDFSGTLSLRNIINGPILPSSKFNYVFSTGILNIEALRYLCASIDLDDDVFLPGNRMCKEFKNKLLTFPAYPNPATHLLNVEWISESAGTLRISLVDALGKNISSWDLSATTGLNHQIIDLNGVGDGLYILLLEDGVTKDAQRIAVVNKP